MSLAANSVFKAASMATNACLLSVPSLSATSKPSCSLPISFKPVKFHLCCSYSKSISFFSGRRKEPFLRVSVISAQQEEDNTVLVEEEEEEEEEGGGLNENDSLWEDDIDGGVEAVGDAGDSEGGVYEEPSEDAKVFVGNLPYDIDSESLANLFGDAGVVEIAEVIYNRDTDRSRGFGFVTMSSVEEAEKAVELFNRYDLNGRLLTVNKASPRGTRPERPPRMNEPGYRIYVGNLPWDVDNTRLEQLFSEHGKVVSAQVVYDRESGRSRGFGFVKMSSESELSDAIANLDGQSLDGRAIRVNVAEERERRSRF